MISSDWKGFNTYKKLACAYGPPGMEGQVREELTCLIKPHVNKIETDRIGNFYATLGPNDAPAIMIGAHMDEVALVASGITSDGQLQVKPQGYFKAEKLNEQQVVILTLKGLIYGRAKLRKTNDKPIIDDVRIDVGASSASDIDKMGIRMGDRICYSASSIRIESELIIGKSADDRTGLYALVEIAQHLSKRALPIRIVFTGTVQEEAIEPFAAWAGAGVAAYRVDPELMLGIDTVDIREHDQDNERDICLEKGIGILRGAQDLHHHLVDHILETASKNGILHQIVPLPSTAADYTLAMRARSGIPCAGLAIPVLHSHCGNETFKWETLELAINLILMLMEESSELLQITNKLP